MDAKIIAEQARQAFEAVSRAESGQKNAVLESMAVKLDRNSDELVAANRADIEDAGREGAPANLVDRLKFDEAKIKGRIASLRKIADLPDPVGQTIWSSRRPNGLEAARVRVPIGVVLMIYEARPHVTVNAGAFCLKSGNAAILRGGSDARRCNTAIGGLWAESLAEAGLPETAVQVVTGPYDAIGELLRLKDRIDLVIPRGGKKLIEAVAEQSLIPVIKHFAGVCHVYIDRGADPDRAVEIALDSKRLMPEVCNAMETLLVCESELDTLAAAVAAFRRWGVEVRGCDKTLGVAPDAKPAHESDWSAEYLDNIVSIRVVGDLDQAVEHINGYGSHHTDAIVTDSESRAREFAERVDSGVVLVNASTMFCDGESLGMGAEIGISTDRLHARGPMGLEDMTTYKFVVRGRGNIMGQQFKTGADA